MDNTKATQENRLMAYLEGKISRSQMLKGALAAGLAAGAAPSVAGAQASTGTSSATGLSFPYFPQVPSGSYTTETIQDIVSNMLTMQYLHLDAGAVLLATPALASRFGLGSGPGLAFVQSFVAIEQYHIDFWSSMVPGAAPKTTTFTVDPKLLADAPTFLTAGEVVDTLRVATDLAAGREFAELGQPTLAKYAAQTLGADAEMRVSIRWLGAVAGISSFTPPTNKAFETDLLLYTRDGVAILQGLGLIGGTGTSISYPGRDKALALAGAAGSAVIQKAANNATSTVAVTGLSSLTAERS